jgi:MinD-like ATPase involved in chromosome partitioning or flagellar assembly
VASAAAPAAPPPAAPAHETPPASTQAPSVPAARAPEAPPREPPLVVVTGGAGAGRPPRAVERVLSGPADHRGGSWREHVRVVPGGHGPGRPDLAKRDRERVLLPIGGPRLVVVLGCTVGAGQTVTTLMIAELLASLRGEAVAALDLNPGRPSLTELARATPAATVPALLAGTAPAGNGTRGRGRLDVVSHGAQPDGQVLGDAEYRKLFEILEERYALTVADPGASAVARVLAATDQLVLVAPASPDAARAVAMTQEWLDAHGYGELSAGSITVINGVSKRSMAHVEQAEVVVRGRCRAIVRVPWDDHLAAPEAERGIRDLRPALDSRARQAPGPRSALDQLRPPVRAAYTALAGVLVDTLAADRQQRRVSQ